MAGTWELTGVPELQKKIDEVTKSMGPIKVEPILNSGARMMSAAVRRLTPVGPTGNLRKAVRTKTLKPLAWNAPAASIAAIDRKKAPHAWLVENRGKSKGFFRRAVDETSGTVIAKVGKDLEKLISEAVK